MRESRRSSEKKVRGIWVQPELRNVGAESQLARRNSRDVLSRRYWRDVLSESYLAKHVRRVASIVEVLKARYKVEAYVAWF